MRARRVGLPLVVAAGLAALIAVAGTGLLRHADRSDASTGYPDRPLRSAAGAHGPVCDRVAALSGHDRSRGTADAPFRTAGRLVSALRPGQTGCLGSGTYREDVTLAQHHVTLRERPGARATIVGRLWVKRGADHDTISGLTLDARNRRGLPSPTINADDTELVGNVITDRHTTICLQIGSPRYGRAHRTVVRENRIHDCGKRPSANRDHGIYVAAADDTRIVDNVIYDNVDRGIQLYPDAQRTLIAGNVIDGNGEGIIFSGQGRVASAGTTVRNNIIANARIRADVESWYPHGSRRGRGNVVRANCLFGGRGGVVDRAAGGFVAIGNTVADPAYVNRRNGDFRLAAGSRCAQLLARSRAPAGLDGQPPTGWVSQPLPARTVG
ncbi:MAG TPA: right-handed parallel beta-helix repeat-containing protein [Baekduia sp.]|nr:right-handed parallel beta-helix repeat-containing protein [Baekduia sp.]